MTDLEFRSQSQLQLPSTSQVVDLPERQGGATGLARARQAVGGRLQTVLGRGKGRRRRLFSFGPRGLFYLVVIAPTALAALYLFLIASDQYVSEAHFVVRSAQRQGVTGLGALLQGSGLSTGGSDTFSVIEYIRSRDSLNEVNAKVDFAEMMSRPGADFLARFPNFYSKGTFEELYDHYLDVVSAVSDSSTGLATLKVRAFTPADSQRLSEALLEASERLVNRMNQRSLSDAVSLAGREVKVAEERSAAAQKALTAFRISAGLVDASSTTKGFMELIGSLEKELSASRAQLTQMRAASPSSPALQPMRDRVSALEQQVAAERGKLLGADGSLVGSYSEFERLTIESEFAAKALLIANSMLESARIEALRKQLYLERVVEPNAADLSRYPRRFLTTISVFGTTFLAYAVAWLLIVNAREHVN